MPHPRMSSEEAGRRADELYANRIRALVETDENIGKLLVIDVETGEYDIDTDINSMALWKRMLAKHPDAVLSRLRIGYPAVHSFGGFRLMPSKR